MRVKTAVIIASMTCCLMTMRIEDAAKEKEMTIRTRDLIVSDTNGMTSEETKDEADHAAEREDEAYLRKEISEEVARVAETKRETEIGTDEVDPDPLGIDEAEREAETESVGELAMNRDIKDIILFN